MPASLLSLKVRGVRSYSPYQHKTQSLEFMPLTLIVGSNGNGKTTIIESLKFIISGEEPPLSDCRRNFLHTPKQNGNNYDKRAPYASIELEFQTARNEICQAKRDIFASAGKASPPTISSSYRVGNKPWINVHKQDDWNKTLPKLFNLPSLAMLNNVILCHQEDNLWCLGDSTNVKQIFDKIFGCEQYKREIKNIDTEIKTCKNELMLGEKDVAFDREKVQRKSFLKNELEVMKFEIDRITKESKILDAEIDEVSFKKDTLDKEVSKLDYKKREILMYKQKLEELKQKEKTLSSNLKTPLIDPQDVSDDELNQKMQAHRELVDRTKALQSKLKREERRLESDLSDLERRKRSLQDEINRLKVMELKLKDTNETMIELLKKMKIEQSVDEINPDDLQASFEALEKFEKMLLQCKSDQTELEEELSSKQQRLSRSINHLEGVCQGLEQKIHNKENFIKTLSGQIAQADPVAKDLLQVTENFGKMSLITYKMPQSELVQSLDNLIEESSRIIDCLINKITKDGVAKLKGDISKETSEIEESKKQLEIQQTIKVTQTEQHSQIELENVKVRSTSKEAHNRMLKFKTRQLHVMDYYNKYKRERNFLDEKNMEAKMNQLALVEKQIEDSRKELSSIVSEQSKLSQEFSDSFERYEEYQNNVHLRVEMRHLKLVQDKFDTLGDEGEVHREMERVTLEASEETARFLELRDKRSRIGGSKAQINYQIERLQGELRSFSKINSKFAENLGKVVCNKIVLSDLEKLKECFQQSITNFHNQMIVKINEVLRIRWRQIYKGSDIDQIELVDEEITRGKDKKAYNYHLAMRKGGVRMRLREKSSAGQKALASIILRMTLAELFVKDFAFIALDEPTANLDHANVQSLAKAIGFYVKRRTERGVNIQWIIITHDENFLKALDAECSPFYYRIQLDNEGCSKIVKISYSDIQTGDSLAPTTQSSR